MSAAPATDPSGAPAGAGSTPTPPGSTVPPRPPSPTPPFTPVAGSGVAGRARVAGVTIVGAALTVALATAVLLPPRGGDDGTAERVQTVRLADLDGAAQTLAPSARDGLLGAARSCQAPLAVMTLTKSPGASGGMIRLRSGNYTSPPFTLADAPQRIAIPFPAAYASGHGPLWVEGAAAGVELTLYPTWRAPQLAGRGLINLTWDTDAPCAS